MKILFLVPYPLNESPSQRFRFEQYFDSLKSRGHTFEIHPFFREQNWRLIYGNKHSFKIWIIISGFWRRLMLVPRISRFDAVFVHREAAPIGPPVFEWLIAKIFRKKIIYDFDDAIWLTDKTNESAATKFFKWRRKVGSICSWSYKVSCGNDYLCNYARQFNTRVIYNPSTIDTSRITSEVLKQTSTEKIVIGWTGSHSTLKYLESLESVFLELERNHPMLEVLVIGDKRPILKIKSMKFLNWSAETELEDLAKIDIGVMPLPDDEWSKGKCGFKALQYMSLGKPAVVSPVGANIQIVENGVNGFHCAGFEDWIKRLSYLIKETAVRTAMGENGRRKVLKDYSVASNTDNFLSLFE
ncbi:MAG TPA: glycosyltransferase family 4 protein [Cyclobacteriaceae bacterium]|nr:glycosyltransferase family 4 protein [Cyclobacteriaceae bacterium]